MFVTVDSVQTFVLFLQIVSQATPASVNKQKNVEFASPPVATPTTTGYQTVHITTSDSLEACKSTLLLWSNELN